MPRVKGGPTHARKRKRVLKRAKGFVSGPGVMYRQAIEFTRRAGAEQMMHKESPGAVFGSRRRQRRGSLQEQ